MQTRLAVRTLEDPRLVTAFSLEMRPSHGRRKSRPPYHVQVLKLSIAPWPLRAVK
jgi:hypothetical protein